MFSNVFNNFFEIQNLLVFGYDKFNYERDRNLSVRIPSMARIHKRRYIKGEEVESFCE